MASDFGKWLKEKLWEKYMTQNDLAKRLGVTRATINYYISGRMKPSGKRMLQIQEVLGEKPKAREKPRNITVWQLLSYMEEDETIQLCFEGDGWENYTELKCGSKLLTQLMDRRIVCMGAEKSTGGQAIRVSIANEGE